MVRVRVRVKVKCKGEGKGKGVAGDRYDAPAGASQIVYEKQNPIETFLVMKFTTRIL